MLKKISKNHEYLTTHQKFLGNFCIFIKLKKFVKNNYKKIYFYYFLTNTIKYGFRYCGIKVA